MGAFAEMFPGRKPEQPAREENLNGQDPPVRFPDGPLDLASGVIRLERRPPAAPTKADPPPDGAATAD